MPRKVIVGCTGSVAAIKVPEIVGELLKLTDVRRNCIIAKLPCFLFLKLEVCVVTTDSSKHFFDPSQLSVTCYGDQDEWVRVIYIIVNILA